MPFLFCNNHLFFILYRACLCISPFIQRVKTFSCGLLRNLILIIWTQLKFLLGPFLPSRLKVQIWHHWFVWLYHSCLVYDDISRCRCCDVAQFVFLYEPSIMQPNNHYTNLCVLHQLLDCHSINNGLPTEPTPPNPPPGLRSACSHVKPQGAGLTLGYQL